LTRTVVTTFAGTPLEQYFANVNGRWPQEYLELNLYAHARFPHELMFTRNLLDAYETKETRNRAAHDLLLREHWQDAADLQAEFFDSLSSDGRMASELAALEALVPDEAKQQANPAAARELAEIDLWQSHFEESASPLSGLAREYPANAAIGDEAESVFRSLAYFDPAKIARAVEIEKNLSAAEPANLDWLTAIGDIYADSTATSLNLDVRAQLASAAPYWRQMTAVHPGETDGYLQAATVFWDYFQFDDALGEIAAARKHFNQPTLFGYEAGAIDENKRDYAAAIAEYTAAAVADGSAAHERLVALAGRKQFADAVDAATAKVVVATPTLAALELRIDVLNAQHREANAEPLVEAAIAKASTMDALEGLETFAQGHQLAKAYREALTREIAVSGDPVQKIELQYQLARAEQDAGDAAGAEQLVAAVYAANPKLVGVVRHTVDFYWANKQQAKAVDVLVASAKAANAEMAQSFTLEAIAKSNESGEYARARELLEPLRKSDPFNAQYLNLEAQSYSLAKDDAGLRDLYVATLAALKAAPMSRDEKRDQMALARQGLIPALTGLKDYAGAVDQHIALISAFPEDDAVLQAATSYARLHGREKQLVGFLQTTVKASPKDSRFAIDLGRVDVQFEDYAGALAAYSAAIAIRSDRSDLYEARVDLEEHQQAFDAACADYERLYVLSYKDPQWMEKEALARAREGKPELAVKALRAAWLDGRTATAADEFRVAEQLGEWNMLAQADGFAAAGVRMAGDDLLALPADQEGALFYARLLARERKAAEAMAFFTKLEQAPGPSVSSPAVVVAQVEKNGIASVTDDDWRKQLVAERKARVEETFGEAVQAIAGVVGEMYTPEEKAQYAALLDAHKAKADDIEVAGTWIPAADAAGLKDREAAWRREILVQGGDEGAHELQPYVALENGRMEYKVLATALDAYAATLKPEQRVGALVMAADAWKGAGDRAQEEAELRKLVVSHGMQEYRERLFDLYLKGNPQALVALTSGSEDTADAAANYLLANGTQAMAEKGVANRALVRPAVWGSATSALVGLYYGETTPKVNAEFEAAVGEATIGQRLAVKPDETKQLIGSDWFYYGTRYGFFLTLGSAPAHDAEDYLPAELERDSQSVAGYNRLAQTYLDAKRVDAAIGEYRHVIELGPDDPTPDVAIAEAEWDAGRKDAALGEWGEALVKLRAMVDLHAVPESFWTEFAAVARDCDKDGVTAKLQPEMNVVLTAYIRKNDDYRATELLQSAWTAENKQSVQAAVDWVLALVAEMKQDEQLTALGEVRTSGWFPVDRFDVLYPREIVLAQMAVTAAAAKAAPVGSENYGLQSAQDQLRSIRVNYIEWLMQHDRAVDAAKVFAEIPETEHVSLAIEELEMRLAAKQGTLAALLRKYREDDSKAPPLETMAQAANALRVEKDFANSRLLLEFVFQRKLEQQSLAGADYLALAEARLATNDMAGAMDLLHRLTLQGDLYENLDSAAALLEKTGHVAEALPLLKKLVAGRPWSDEVRLRLGRAELTVKDASASATLAAVGKDAQAAYATRAAAAMSLHEAGGVSGLGSEELNLVAAQSATAEAAGKPYFVYARIAAASSAAPPVRVALLRAALEATPDAMHDWLRLRIFEAEMARGKYEEASVAIGPVLEANSSLRPATATPSEADADSTTDASAEDNGGDASNGSASMATVVTYGTADAGAKSGEFVVATAISSDAQKLEFVMKLAEMDEHLGQDAVLMQDLQAAKSLTTDAAEKAKLDARMASLQRRMDVEHQNAQRRPGIQKQVEQTVLVRPRVMLAEVQR
jgi:replicative superfamily II helicase